MKQKIKCKSIRNKNNKSIFPIFIQKKDHRMIEIQKKTSKFCENSNSPGRTNLIGTIKNRGKAVLL